MKTEIILFLFASISLIDSGSTIYKVKTKIFRQSAFEVPVNTHYIETLTNIRNHLRCAIVCERHPICRTAEYDTTNQSCRLFETLATAGTMYFDSTKITLMLDYCLDEDKTEPNYICNRVGTYSVQEVFDQLSLAPNINLPLGNRGSYANMYGVYTTDSSGTIAFYSYTGNQTIIKQISSEITNMNSATSIGFAIVQYYLFSATIYNNNGTPTQPQLISIHNLSLPAQPYACVVTPHTVYVTYNSSFLLMTIHNLSSDSFSYVNQTNMGNYRPVIGQWKDTILTLDQYQAKLYDLNGVYQGNWPYFSGPHSGRRHYVHYDYAGRVYTCNDGAPNAGIYAFLNNGTQIANGPTSCSRCIQFYVTKEQAALVNIPGKMNVIYFP